MKNPLDQFLAEVPIIKIPDLLDDYEVFRKTGSIGDCVLREYTEKFMEQNEIEGPSALWLDRVGLEAYRYSALVLMGKAAGVILKDL